MELPVLCVSLDPYECISGSLLRTRFSTRDSIKKPPAHEHHVCRPWPVQDPTPEDQPIIARSVRHAPAAGSPRLSRRERRTIATREALITAAQEVIAVQGVYLAIIEEITECADVAKGSFYQYFRNRDELLDVLLTRRLNALRTRIEATPPMGTFAACVRTLIGHHLDYFLHHADFLFFLHQIRGLMTLNQEETTAMRDAYRRYLGFVAAQLAAHDAPCPGKGLTPEAGACALLGVLTGFLSHYVGTGPIRAVAAASHPDGNSADQCLSGILAAPGARLTPWPCRETNAGAVPSQVVLDPRRGVQRDGALPERRAQDLWRSQANARQRWLAWTSAWV